MKKRRQTFFSLPAVSDLSHEPIKGEGEAQRAVPLCEWQPNQTEHDRPALVGSRPILAHSRARRGAEVETGNLY